MLSKTQSLDEKIFSVNGSNNDLKFLADQVLSGPKRFLSIFLVF